MAANQSGDTSTLHLSSTHPPGIEEEVERLEKEVEELRAQLQDIYANTSGLGLLGVDSAQLLTKEELLQRLDWYNSTLSLMEAVVGIRPTSKAAGSTLSALEERRVTLAAPAKVGEIVIPWTLVVQTPPQPSNHVKALASVSTASMSPLTPSPRSSSRGDRSTMVGTDTTTNTTTSGTTTYQVELVYPNTTATTATAESRAAPGPALVSRVVVSNQRGMRLPKLSDAATRAATTAALSHSSSSSSGCSLSHQQLQLVLASLLQLHHHHHHHRPTTSKKSKKQGRRPAAHLMKRLQFGKKGKRSRP